MKRYGIAAATLFCVIVSLQIASGQSIQPTGQQEETQKKQELYGKFTSNYKTDTKAAYTAAKDYLSKYSSDKDAVVDYLSKWIASYDYDKQARKVEVTAQVFNNGDYAKAFQLGKQVLADEPESLRTLIDLGYAGFISTVQGKNDIQSESTAFAEHAIKLIEQGQTLSDWAPFVDKTDTLGWLNFSLGAMSLKDAPDKAGSYLFKAIQYGGGAKSYGLTYYYVSVSYQNGAYKRATDVYQKFEGKEETPESKVAVDGLNSVLDHVIDAYARAIGLTTKTDPKSQQAKTEWIAKVT